MYKFTGFTEKANRALNSAIEIAENLGHTYIGSEHLLAGILREDNGIGTSLLGSKGMNIQLCESAIRRSVGVGIPTALSPDDFTPRCKHIIEQSVSLARRESAGYIGTEHLLSSMLHEEDCLGCRILSESGISVPLLLDELSGGTSGKKSYSANGYQR